MIHINTLQMMKQFIFPLLTLILLSPSLSNAQKTYENLNDAILSASNLRGANGPRNVVWINDGEQYSFSKNVNGKQEIWIHDIKSGSETQVFSPDGLKLEDGSDFKYRSFQLA